MRLALVLFFGLLAACAPATAAPPPHLVASIASTDLTPGEDELTMEVIELMCRPCASRIVASAKDLAGVTAVHMELASKTLTLRFDTRLTGRATVVAAIEDIVSRIQ